MLSENVKMQKVSQNWTQTHVKHILSPLLPSQSAQQMKGDNEWGFAEKLSLDRLLDNWTCDALLSATPERKNQM